MRKAAGIILIISGVLWLTGVVMSLIGLYTNLLPYFYVILWRLVSIALLVAGGIFCLRRRYWRECFATALVVFFFGLSTAINYVRYIAALREGVFYGGVPAVASGGWILLPAGVISLILIWRARKEWREISDSVDGKVTYDG